MTAMHSPTLSPDQAIALLPDGDRLAIRRAPRAGLFLAGELPRVAVVEKIRTHGAALAPGGLLLEDLIGPLFVALPGEATRG